MILSRGACISRQCRLILSRPSLSSYSSRFMATIRSSLPHEERTAEEPRENVLESVILSHIRNVNDNIRLLRLNAVDPNHTIKFLPGQWLDTFIPGLPKAGGFTVTSTPSEARPSSHSSPYLELAVQKSTNPPAQWLWRPQEDILGTRLTVRVGGSFTWPPPGVNTAEIERLVLIAGGVGIKSSQRPREIHFIYGTKGSPELNSHEILFLPRLMDLVAAAADVNVNLRLFVTDTGETGPIEHGRLPNRTLARRMTAADIVQAIDGYQQGSQDCRSRTLCFVCGPPAMTDGFVEFLIRQPGMSKERVLCEKWW